MWKFVGTLMLCGIAILNYSPAYSQQTQQESVIVHIDPDRLNAYGHWLVGAVELVLDDEHVYVGGWQVCPILSAYSLPADKGGGDPRSFKELVKLFASTHYNHLREGDSEQAAQEAAFRAVQDDPLFDRAEFDKDSICIYSNNGQSKEINRARYAFQQMVSRFGATHYTQLRETCSSDEARSAAVQAVQDDPVFDRVEFNRASAWVYGKDGSCKLVTFTDPSKDRDEADLRQQRLDNARRSFDRILERLTAGELVIFVAAVTPHLESFKMHQDKVAAELHAAVGAKEAFTTENWNGEAHATTAEQMRNPLPLTMCGGR